MLNYIVYESKGIYHRFFKYFDERASEVYGVMGEHKTKKVGKH